MVSADDPVESFFNSLQLVKDALLPLELGIRTAVKDFEHCWPGLKNGVNDLELVSTKLNNGLNSKVRVCSVKEKSNYYVVGDELKLPIKTLLDILSQNCANNGHRVDLSKNGLKEGDVDNEGGTCMNFLQFGVPDLFENNKNQVHKMGNEGEVCSSSCAHASKPKVSCKMNKKQSSCLFVASFPDESVVARDQGKSVSTECFIGFIFDQLTQNLQKFDSGFQERKCASSESFTGILETKKTELNGFLVNLKFARVGGVPEGIVGVSSSVKEERKESVAYGITEEDYPDKKKLFSVQDFFRYTESEGRRLFEELDRDGDGQVNLEDLEVAMRKRRLPQRYAREFMRHTRSHLFSKSFGWKQFLSLMDQKEPTILRAYTTLCLTKSGTLQKSEILASLKNAGLPANEDNAVAIMRSLNADTEESISYGHFRNLMLLLPSDRLQKDTRSIWFEAATVVAVAPPVELPSGSVLKSALAGGLSCAFSAAIMHPVDTVKTRVQSSTLTFPEILSKLPQIGVRGIYSGSIPAILGQFSSHGLRSGIFEASRFVLINVAPTLPEIQVESVSSFCGTFLGTVMRIPCEVLKQRLQAGIFDNVGEAIVGTWRQDGLKGFFRGTGATLCREIPFYVAGAGLYAESKKVVQQLLGRELEHWETIAIGALSGGLTAVLTTPFDVIKTRMMTASQGQPLSSSMVAFYILRHEGPIGLFRGAVPRFFWVAPLGAINFAGYEILRRAMDKNEEQILKRS